MRTIQLVGQIVNHKTIKLARQCAWCRRWFTLADYLAAHKDHAKVTHGCCPSCFKKQMAALDALDTKPAA